MSDRTAFVVFVALCAVGGFLFASMAVLLFDAPWEWALVTFLAGSAFTGDVVLSA